MIDLSEDDPDWDPSDQDYAQREEAPLEFSVAVVNEETTEKIQNMIINKVSLGTGAIDVSVNDKFCLVLESNINISNEFDTAVSGRMKTMYIVMRVGTYVSKKSLAINHEMVQDR